MKVSGHLPHTADILGHKDTLLEPPVLLHKAMKFSEHPIKSLFQVLTASRAFVNAETQRARNREQNVSTWHLCFKSGDDQKLMGWYRNITSKARTQSEPPHRRGAAPHSTAFMLPSAS